MLKLRKFGTSIKQIFTREERVWFLFPFPFVVFLFILSFVSYWPIINNSFVSDDYSFISIYSDVTLSDPRPFLYSSIPDFVRPISMMTWWIQIQIFGTAPTPGHVINILLHAGNASLLFLLLKRLSASTIAAAFASCLFVVTPLGPEVVTFVTGRTDLLPMFFILLTLTFYFIYLEKGSRLSMAVSLFCAFLAFFSKEQAMILFFLFPAIEILYGPNSQSLLSPRQQHRDENVPYSRIILADLGMLVRRPPIAIFMGFFIASFLIRLAFLGNMGGYQPIIGVPNIHATVRSLRTLLAPMNIQIFSAAAIHKFAVFSSILGLLSLIALLSGWRKAPTRLKRLWVFLAIFSLVSIMPVAWRIFVVGVGNDLDMSRFFYSCLAGLLPMMTIALFDFHDKGRAYGLIISLILVFLLSINIYVLNINNRLWEKSAAISWAIPEQTVNQLPDPPQDSKLYYQDVPSWIGVWCFGTDIEPAIRQKYGRNDLVVRRVDEQISEGPVPPSETGDGYLFDYDSDSGVLILKRGPEW
ncbi:MAG: hypothetical protein WC911_07570 [Thermoleophilia bacterium]